MSRLTLDIREVVSLNIRAVDLRSTVSIINRSLDKLVMPPSVSVFGFRTRPRHISSVHYAHCDNSIRHKGAI